MVQISHPYMTTGKTPVHGVALLEKWYLCFLICCLGLHTFLPRSKCLLISWLQSPSTVTFLEPKKVNSVNKIKFHFFSIYLQWNDGTGCYDFSFWMLSFKSVFSLSSFTIMNRLFSYSLLSAIRVVSSAYLRFLMFLLEILIPACDSFSLAFCMMYSAQKLNMQGDTIQLWCTLPNLEPVHCSMSSSNCCFLTCKLVSQEAGKLVWNYHLFKNFPQFVVIHTVKEFSTMKQK